MLSKQFLNSVKKNLRRRVQIRQRRLMRHPSPHQVKWNRRWIPARAVLAECIDNNSGKPSSRLVISSNIAEARYDKKYEDNLRSTCSTIAKRARSAASSRRHDDIVRRVKRNTSASSTTTTTTPRHILVDAVRWRVSVKKSVMRCSMYRRSAGFRGE